VITSRRHRLTINCADQVGRRVRPNIAVESASSVLPTLSEIRTLIKFRALALNYDFDSSMQSPRKMLSSELLSGL